MNAATAGLEMKVDRLETKVDRIETVVDRLDGAVRRLELGFVRLETMLTATLPHLVTKVEQMPRMENRQMVMVLSPR